MNTRTHARQTYRPQVDSAIVRSTRRVEAIGRSPDPGSGNYIPPLLITEGRWIVAEESDPFVKGLIRRSVGAMLGLPNRSMARGSDRLMLITHQGDALMVFHRRPNHGGDPLTDGVQCTLFRNEGHFRCGSLIREAVEQWAVKRWPGERLFALAEGCRMVASNPGYCFVRAGWIRCGESGGVIVMEWVPPTPHSPSPPPP